MMTEGEIKRTGEMIYSCVYSHDIIQKGEFNFGGFSYSNQATKSVGELTSTVPKLHHQIGQ